MDSWWLIIICIAVAIALHFIAARARSAMLSVIVVIAHVLAIIALLLLEVTLKQLLVFMLASVASNLIIWKLMQRKAVKERSTGQEESVQ